MLAMVPCLPHMTTRPPSTGNTQYNQIIQRLKQQDPTRLAARFQHRFCGKHKSALFPFRCILNGSLLDNQLNHLRVHLYTITLHDIIFVKLSKDYRGRMLNFE